MAFQSKSQRRILPEQFERLPSAGEAVSAVAPLQGRQIELRSQLYAGVAGMLIPTISQGPTWQDIAHDFQKPPSGDWTVWMLLAGRGSGKTRAAAEYVTDEIMSGRASVVGLIGPTAGDVRDVMVEGPAGLLKVAEQRGIQCFYQPSKRRVIWPEFGAAATLFSAQEPRRLRGPQHDLLWAEEIAAWQDAWQGDVEETTWNNAMFGLRLGQNPKAIITTTPKANKLTRELVKRAKEDDDYAISSGSTYANRKNLAPSFFKDVIRRYEGTRLGRQEIEGQLLEDVEGALWLHEWIDRGRIIRGDWYPLWRATFNRDVAPVKVRAPLPPNLLLPVPGMYEEEIEEPRVAPLPDLVKVVVSIDPNTTSNPTADVAGIVVAARGSDGDGYVFDDRSAIVGPTEWARLAIDAYHEWLADKIVAERNNGGEMVKITLRQHDENVPVDLVWASRGKITRAEPVASLYEQGRIHHVGAFPELEDEYCSFVPGAADVSPGRLDAAVWALTELFDLTADGPDQRSRKLVVIDG
jgi:phage terminase large subunit-like protein